MDTGCQRPVSWHSYRRLKQILISQLNSLQEAGINAIIFRVRPEADALYASQYEQWSRFLTGTQEQTPSPMWDIDTTVYD